MRSQSKTKTGRAHVHLLFLCVFFLAGCSGGEPQEITDVPEKEGKRIVHSSFFHEQRQYEEMYSDSSEILPIEEKVYGGILPHHLFVGKEFGKFFTLLSTQNPEVVVIIGPNHSGGGKGKILTPKIPYWTPYGILEPDASIIERITERGLVEIDEAPFAEEHSISSEVAFVKRTFPNAKIVPIILKTDTPFDDANALGILLSRTLPENSLVLASVDFSHYQPEIVADFHDQTSLSTILNFHFSKVYSLEIDSPASISALLRYLKEKGAMRNLTAKHTNSASYSHQPEMEETTSHFFLSFGKGEGERKFGASILFFGDSIFDRGIEEVIASKGEDYLFENLQGKEGRFFAGNHFNVLNFEGPMTDAESPANKPIVFNHNEGIAMDQLKKGKFNLVNLANNHTNDYFQEGLDDTVAILESNTIHSFGYPDPCRREIVQEFTVSFCGFDDINRTVKTDEMREVIVLEAENSDAVVVSVHWGNEDTPVVSSRQRELGYAFIDAGADVVIGHHPHVIQETEIYQSKPIVYSLGNFIFDQNYKPNIYELGVGMFLEEEKITVYFYPLKMEHYRPRFMNAEERKEFYDWYTDDFREYGSGIDGKIILDDAGR